MTMSETTKPRHHEDADFLRRSADRMADAIERLVLLGRIDSRSEAADAALDYRNPQFDRLDRIELLEAACRAALLALNSHCFGNDNFGVVERQLREAIGQPDSRCNCWLGEPVPMGGDARVREKCPVHGDAATVLR
jgi:signal transduction histidine kinase